MARRQMAWSRGGEQAARRGRGWAGYRLVVALLLGMAAAGCSTTPRPSADAGALPAAATTSTLQALSIPPIITTASTTTTAPPLPELPRGGRRIFPHFRVVGYYGMPGLDALGAGPPELVARRLLRTATAYATPGHPVLPMLELIATIAHPRPLSDGTYRSRQDDAVVARYLQAARRIKGVLVLDIQPGRADFLAEVRHWERLLREPDVGIALDPEFSMAPGGVPGRDLGRTDAATINRVSAYLAGLVARHRLPEKLLVIHQFTHSMVRDKPAIVVRRGLAMVWNADGFGARSDKLEDYAAYTSDRRFHPGLKLFYRNDVDLMAPHEVLRLRPVPQLINYQ
jgi:hypothetical protein